MNIGLLQCDHVSDQFQHIISDYPDAFCDLFARHAPHISLRVYDVCHGVLPQSLDECDGYITTGSRYSVYDDEGWIHHLCEFVRQVHDQSRKLVGICFGHQMIAHALGGTVAKSDNGWGIGAKTVDILQTRPWMQPPQESYRLLVSHQDQVLALPPGAEVLGGNVHCPVSMFTVGNHMLGFQAHPEFTPDYAEALMDARLERIGYDVVQDARLTLNEPTDEVITMQWINAFFSM